MHMVSLSREQTAVIHREHLVFDFPPEEAKPLEMILRAMDAGCYEGFGLMEDGQLLAYAFFVKERTNLLLDYLAVVRGKRDLGLGSRFLKLLCRHCAEAASLLIEIEEPDRARTEAERALRLRRRSFYLQNGLVETGVNGSAFGVEFRLLELPQCGVHSPDQIRSLYLSLYRQVLPQQLWSQVQV